jgi:predicted phosphodiesterase
VKEIRLAVVADIHGNWRALEAVLADISRRAVARVVNLGDSLYGPFDPVPVADRLLASGWPTVSGNEDRCLVEPDIEGAMARFTRAQLSDRHIDWLHGLPSRLSIDEIAIAFHASPEDDARYLLHAPSSDGSMRPRMPDEIATDLRGVEARLVLCAHDHLPRVVELEDGRTIVNPGSVGCPAYTDDHPIPHRVENGTPHARYAVVRIDNGSVDVECLSVAYDWDAAASEAAVNGFPDWAARLRTGRTS